MPQLIDNGYIYIAQPPLYRAKRGKSETYIKDDRDLETFLIQARRRGAAARGERIGRHGQRRGSGAPAAEADDVPQADADRRTPRPHARHRRAVAGARRARQVVLRRPRRSFRRLPTPIASEGPLGDPGRRRGAQPVPAPHRGSVHRLSAAARAHRGLPDDRRVSRS